MDFELSETEKAFRDEVRAWLKANAPHDAEGSGDMKSFIDSRRAWQKKLFDAGFVGLTWPEEYGGRGAGFMEQLIFNDEMIIAHAPEPINVIGLGMGGVPKRATYLVDRAGVIQYVDCNEDARVVPDFNKVKAKLAELE